MIINFRSGDILCRKDKQIICGEAMKCSTVDSAKNGTLNEYVQTRVSSENFPDSRNSKPDLASRYFQGIALTSPHIHQQHVATVPVASQQPLCVYISGLPENITEEELGIVDFRYIFALCYIGDRDYLITSFPSILSRHFVR